MSSEAPTEAIASTTISIKKPKLPKPTKAELRQQRLIAAELKQKQNVREHLAREIKFTEKSIARGWDDWEKLCVDITHEKLKEETQVLIQGVNRSMDKADHLIEMIQRDREMAEEMYRRNVHRHTDLLNVMIDIFQTFVKSAQSDFDNVRESLIAQFYDEYVYPKKLLADANQICNTFRFCTDVSFEVNLKKIDQKLIDDCDEIQATSVEWRQILKQKAFEEQTRLLEVMKEIIDLFRNRIWPKKIFQEYTAKLNLFNQDQCDFKQFDEEAERNEATIKSLKKASVLLEENQMKEVISLKHDHELINELMQTREKNAKMGTKIDSDRLEQLCLVSYRALKSLEEKRRKGRVILDITSICQKYEKPTDCYLNFQLHELQDDPLPQTPFELAIEAFRSKISRVETQNLALKATKIRLLRKNDELTNIIKKNQNEKNVQENMDKLNLNLKISGNYIPFQIYSQMPQLRNFKKTCI